MIETAEKIQEKNYVIQIWNWVKLVSKNKN